MTLAAPRAITIFSYQVGFGDCFLLRFDYGDEGRRHILIDFGTTKLPPGAPPDQMKRIADDIAKKCGGQLEAVVATHRHADHVSGFATKPDGSGSGDVIRALNPKIVLQPWTEAPDADDATLGPVISSGQRTMGQKLAALEAMHGVAERAVEMLRGKGLDRAPAEVRDQIDFIGRDNIKNLSAVENLMTMANNVYSYHGGPSGLDALLPGVAVTVLGPPTLAQTQSIRKQRSRDPDEFWQLSLAALENDDALHGSDRGERLFPNHPVFPAGRVPIETIWLRDRIDEARTGQMLSIVRSLDDQMNNTSLILLFEAGGKSLLFPGDAQIENWRYTLESSGWAARLAAVDLYKVGHHGSLNATPKSLWNHFAKKGAPSRQGRLKSMLSTLPGKHGREKDNSEVPRRTLLAALKGESELHSTHELAADQLCQEVTVLLSPEDLPA
jgi:hypothetical protein